MNIQIEDDTGRETTYRELIVKVKRLGAALLKQGIKPGDVITICSPTCIEHVLLFYATARVGAVWHFTHADYPEGK